MRKNKEQIQTYLHRLRQSKTQGSNTYKKLNQEKLNGKRQKSPQAFIQSNSYSQKKISQPTNFIDSQQFYRGSIGFSQYSIPQSQVQPYLEHQQLQYNQHQYQNYSSPLDSSYNSNPKFIHPNRFSRVYDQNLNIDQSGLCLQNKNNIVKNKTTEALQYLRSRFININNSFQLNTDQLIGQYQKTIKDIRIQPFPQWDFLQQDI